MEKKRMMKKKKTMTMATCNARGGDLDLISELPDHILHHILSFLDMTYVIQTCFLSKRWRNIWSSLPFLNFDEKLYTEKFQDQEELFPIFVDQVLIFRNQKSNIQTFRVFHSNGEDYTILSHIYAWIHTLIRSNVQVIDLQVAMYILDYDKLPTYLFTCNSLTILKLAMDGQNFDPPDYALKTLQPRSLVLESSVEILNLQTLIFKVTKYSSPKSAAKVKFVSVKEWGSQKADSAPQIIMHQLKLVQIWDVLATANEVEFFKFLLKNAAVLEKQQFPENDKRFKSFDNKLLSYCGALSNAEIVLV